MSWKKDFEEQFHSESGDCCAWHSNFELQLFITKLIQEIIDDLESNPDPDIAEPTLPFWIELKQKQLKKKYL